MANRKKTSKSRNDSAVQGTNDSSIVSKCSTASHEYFDDEYLACFVAKQSRRAPLIHRVYHVRAAAMEYCFHQFLDRFAVTPNQILLLGAGFDSSYFRLKAKGLLKSTVVFEVDFPDVMLRKRRLIEHHEALQALLSETVLSSGINNCVLETRDLKLLGVDLTETKTLTSTLQQVGCDFSRPTLVVSEVVLAYMSAKSSTAVIHWASESFANSMFALYEQIQPNDAFGLFMQKHFNNIGSPLRTLNTYPFIREQSGRFSSAGWERIIGMDMNQFYYGFVPGQQRKSIETLEPFDEYEEFHLACSHYLLLCAFKGCCNSLEVKFSCDGRDLTPASTEISCTTDEQSSCVEMVTKSIENTLEMNIPAINREELLWRIMEPVQQCEMAGHAAVALTRDIVLCTGGYGWTGKAHARLQHLTFYNIGNNSAQILYPSSVDAAALERVYHTTNVLEEGRIFIFGGRHSPMKPCQSAHVLQIGSENSCHGNCASGTEEPVAKDVTWSLESIQVTMDEISFHGDIPSPRWRHTATKFQVDGVVHVFLYGGRDAHNILEDAYVLNTQTWTWTKVVLSGAAPGPRFGHTASLGDGVIYVVGGIGPDGLPMSHIHCFHLDTYSWSHMELKEPLLPRYSHCALVADKRLVLVGGIATSLPSPGLTVIDLHSRVTTEKSLPDPDLERLIMLHGHAVVHKDDQQLLVIGGGGNCFSFGTHFNAGPVVIDLSEAGYH